MYGLMSSLFAGICSFEVEYGGASSCGREEDEMEEKWMKWKKQTARTEWLCSTQSKPTHTLCKLHSTQ